MDGRFAVALFLVLVSLTLVAAPYTMADWAQQGSHSVTATEESELREGTPVLQFDELSSSAQAAVRPAIETMDRPDREDLPADWPARGSHTVYGADDLPDEFRYSDYSSPGSGIYAVEYEGQLYELTTAWSAGFPFVYWLLALPFVAYGLGLGAMAFAVDAGRYSSRAGLVAAVPVPGFHLLGPEFDFPLLGSSPYVALGVAACVALLAGVLYLEWNRRLASGADGAGA